MFFSVRNKQDIMRVQAYIGSLGFMGKVWCVRVDEYKPKRSLSQNRCFHAMCGELAKHKGYSPEEMKVLIKAHFGLFHYVANKKTGEVIPALKSTADLSVEDFANLITNTEILCAKEGIVCQRDEDYFEAIGLRTEQPGMIPGRQAAVCEHRQPPVLNQMSEGLKS